MRQVVIATVNFEVDIDLLIIGSRHFFKHSAENILRQDIWNWHVVFSLSILWYYCIQLLNFTKPSMVIVSKILPTYLKIV